MKIEEVVLSKDKVTRLKMIYWEKKQPRMKGYEWQMEKRPLILIIPGGGYEYVSDREADSVSAIFLKNGFQTAILNYHVKDESNFKNNLEDIVSAMKYLRENKDKYSIDEDKIAVLGFSAGGHLAAMLSSLYKRKDLTGEESELIKPNLQLLAYPVLDLKSFVDGKFDNVGGIFRKYDKLADPLANINESIPDTFIFSTFEDDVVDFRTHLEYIKKLKEYSIHTEYHLFEKGYHGLSTADNLTNYGRDYERRDSMWMDILISYLNRKFQII